MGKPSKNWLIPLTLIIGSILVASALAEGALRLAGISYPSFFEFDPSYGLARHRPGAKGWWTSEGRAYVRINSDGLRDREHGLTKPAGTLRIAVLGDSFAEAFQVDADKAFWAVMQRRLDQCDALGGRRVEVINFGVSGYGTAQEWVTLQKDVWKYDPDIVLLAFLTANDIRNNSYPLEGDPYRPYYVLRNNKLEFTEAPAGYKYKPLQGIRNWLLDHSRLAQLVNFVHAVDLKPRVALAQAAPASAGMDRLEEKIYRPPEDAVWVDAWQVTKALLKGMNRDVKAHGKQFFIATLSNGIQTDPDPLKREAFARRFGVSDLLYPDKQIMQLAKQERIPSAMLAPAELEWAEKHKTCVHGFNNGTHCGGHWNEYGHQVAGEFLAREICDQILSKQLH